MTTSLLDPSGPPLGRGCPVSDDDPDSPIALAAWLGLHPECGCPLGDCRCDDDLEPDLDGQEDDR